MICDCGEFLNATHESRATDRKLYDCTCGRKYMSNGERIMQITNNEHKRISHQFRKI
jgi:hypothetical protein